MKKTDGLTKKIKINKKKLRHLLLLLLPLLETLEKKTRKIVYHPS